MRSLRCSRFFLKIFFTRNNRKAARSIVRIFLVLPSSMVSGSLGSFDSGSRRKQFTVSLNGASRYGGTNFVHIRSELGAHYTNLFYNTFSRHYLAVITCSPPYRFSLSIQIFRAVRHQHLIYINPFIKYVHNTKAAQFRFREGLHNKGLFFKNLLFSNLNNFASSFVRNSRL